MTTTVLDDFDLDIRIGDRLAVGTAEPASATYPTDPRFCDPFTELGCPIESDHRTVCC